MVSTLVWSSRLIRRWARPSAQHRMMRARCTSRCGDVRFRITTSRRFRSSARNRRRGAGATGMMEPPCSHCCNPYSIYQSSAHPRQSATIVVLFVKRGTSLWDGFSNLSFDRLESRVRPAEPVPHGFWNRHLASCQRATQRVRRVRPPRIEASRRPHRQLKVIGPSLYIS